MNYVSASASLDDSLRLRPNHLRHARLIIELHGPQNLHDLFATTAGISGALIGFLFVALSVSRQQFFAHRIRAGASMTMFLNVLLVSLFGVLSRSGFSGAVSIIAVVGIGDITMILISWFRERRGYPSKVAALRDLAFLPGIMASCLPL